MSTAAVILIAALCLFIGAALTIAAQVLLIFFGLSETPLVMRATPHDLELAQDAIAARDALREARDAAFISPDGETSQYMPHVQQDGVQDPRSAPARPPRGPRLNCRLCGRVRAFLGIHT